MNQVAAYRGMQRFCASLQSAASVEEVTTAYLNTVGNVIPADAVAIQELGSTEWWSTASQQLHEAYEEYGRQDDPVLRFVIDKLRPIDSSRVSPEHEWTSCGARQALGLEGFAHSMEAPLIVSGMLFGTLNFARASSSPTFTRQDLASVGLVSEQFGLATERALRYEATGHRATTLERALDQVSHGVIVTDLDGEVVYQNRAARNGWELDGGVGDASQNGAIADCIATAMTAFRDDGRRVFLQKVATDDGDRRALVKSYRLSGKDRTAVTLLFDYEAGESAPRRLPVWDVLTRREQEIAQMVSEGLTNKQIAARGFVSENTVKQHLKRVFAKTDVNTRAELIQLIWMSGRSAE